MIDESAVLLDRWRGVLWSGPKEKLLGRELTRQTASAGSLLSNRWRCDIVLVWERRQWLLAVFEHAQEGQHLFS
jgi:hypothetical protein